MRTAPTPLHRYLIIASTVLVLDQVTKIAAQIYLPIASPVVINSYLNWFLIFNPGAAFSFLSQAGGWQRWFFTILGIAASVVILWFLRRNTADQKLSWALSLILGGAIGNVLDRIFYGAVVDFIDVHYETWHWPAFNLADSAISVGAVLIVWSELTRPKI
jgi:signal peptidase II